MASELEFPTDELAAQATTTEEKGGAAELAFPTDELAGPSAAERGTSEILSFPTDSIGIDPETDEISLQAPEDLGPIEEEGDKRGLKVGFE